MTFCKTFYTQKVHMSMYDKAGYCSITLSFCKILLVDWLLWKLLPSLLLQFIFLSNSLMYFLCVFSFINFLAKLCLSMCIWLHACLKAFLFLQTHTHTRVLLYVYLSFYLYKYIHSVHTPIHYIYIGILIWNSTSFAQQLIYSTKCIMWL